MTMPTVSALDFLTPEQTSIRTILINRAGTIGGTPDTVRITYGMLDRQIGRHPADFRHRSLAHDLRVIATVEHTYGRPLLPALVVTAELLMPGPGFARMAKGLGYQSVGDGPDSAVAFWYDELGRVLRYWRHQ